MNVTHDYIKIDLLSTKLTSNLSCEILETGFKRLIDNLKTFLSYGLNTPNNNKQYPLIVKVYINSSTCETIPQAEMNEKYILDVTAESEMIINCNSVWGALRAFTTLSQIIHLNPDLDGDSLVANISHIIDEPRFQYRGILLDTSRHFLPVNLLLRNLDAMEMNKLNVFHWHIVDDQSFPFFSQKFPKLSEKGAYSQKLVYSQKDVDKILTYAHIRGIRVMVEFDTPGHTLSWGKYLPQLLTTCYRSASNPNLLDSISSNNKQKFPNDVLKIDDRDYTEREQGKSNTDLGNMPKISPNFVDNFILKSSKDSNMKIFTRDDLLEGISKLSMNFNVSLDRNILENLNAYKASSIESPKNNKETKIQNEEMIIPNIKTNFNGINGFVSAGDDRNSIPESSLSLLVKESIMGPINPIGDFTYPFLSDLFGEIMERFPEKYIHLGGDEVIFTCWASNPDIQEFMKRKGWNSSNYPLLENYFVLKLIDILKAKDPMRKFVVWQEIFDNLVHGSGDERNLAYFIDKTSTIVQIWRSGWTSKLKAILKAKLYAILSSPWYLNYVSYGRDWQTYYLVDPFDSDNITDVDATYFLGGEACMWGEFIDETNLLSTLWPRAAAVAERLWSPSYINNVTLASPRLQGHRCRMKVLGIPASPILGPSYCPHEI
ncbi:beta-hexosaminidase subunit alpha-like isoform X1 [Gordionus sp. m RMFG-2023]|uniref:beta-hexosaminidase subunit alpha-like isoform X1 n=2 Tax=Gordionus sp. m RMFG-2023 TaxID=3053472 RepID=UPI0031FD73E7